MIGYIRDPRTWSAVKTVTVTSYELPLETAQGETGKVTILGQLDADYSGYVLSIEDMGYVFKIKEQQSGSTTETTLSVSDSVSLLENSVLTTGQTTTVITDDFLRRIGGISGTEPEFQTYTKGILNDSIRNHHYNARAIYTRSDFAPNEFMFMPGDGIPYYTYLAGLNIPISDFEFTEIQNQGRSFKFFDAEKTLRKLREYGVHYEAGAFSEEYNGHVIQGIGFKIVCNETTSNIPFNDGHSELISESYNDDICNRVIIISETSYDWQDFPGKCLSIFTTDGAGYTVTEEYDDSFGSAELQADAIFAKNTHSHKIEFASDKELHIGQAVRLMLSRGILDTAISKVMLKSGDNRYYYTCGELPVTATERIKADGWSYGKRLPSNPRKGQLFILED